MAKVTLQRAAELTGKARSTIHRAMASGRLSFEKDGNGDRLVDVSELERVFGISPERNDAPALQQDDTHPSEMRTQLELSRLKAEMLQERLDEMREERTQLLSTIREKEETIARKDELLAEQMQTVKLLTDQRTKKKKWWWW